MKIIAPSIILEYEIDGIAMCKNIERCARTCYKSEQKITDNSYEKIIQMLIKNGHESALEHEKVTMRIVCDRGVTHELVRHRIGSYSQESTRYCNYSADKFGNELTFIEPYFWDDDDKRMQVWKKSMQNAENAYFELLNLGASPQEARGVLPNSLKTEIVVTYNLREWRHFLKLRTDKAAHPQMRQIAIMCLGLLRGCVPVVFDDIVLL